MRTPNRTSLYITIFVFIVIGISFLGQSEDRPFTETATSTTRNNQPASLFDRRFDAMSPDLAIAHEEAVVRSIENAAPAVVSIIVSKDLPVIERCQIDPFRDLPPEFRQFFGNDFFIEGNCEQGTEVQEIGGGSGFIVTTDGLVITNRHVVSDTEALYTVILNDGSQFDARVLSRHPALDVAIVQIESANRPLPVVSLGDSDTVRLGQTAIAIGNALAEFQNSVSVGVVSGLSRNIIAQSQGSLERVEGVIQTDAAINPGNSGGPLLNLRGEVIGINTAMATGAENIGFAIPINQAKQAVESVQRTGRIQIPYLGVRYLMITPELAVTENLKVTEGALLRGSEDGPAIVRNSPAEKAGLKEGDIITKVGDRSVNRQITLGSHIQRHAVSETIVLTVERGSRTIKIEVTLEERAF